MKNSIGMKGMVTMLMCLSCLMLEHLADAEEQGKIRIAVMDFTQTTQAPELQDLDKIVPEWLTMFLVEAGIFEMIERRELEKVLKEQSLGQTGIIDSASAAQLGKVMGVNMLVTGNVIMFEDTIEITARLIDTTNGAILGVVSVTTDDKSEIRSKVQELAASIRRKLSENPESQEKNNVMETFEGTTLDLDRWELGFDENMKKSDQNSTHFVQEQGVLRITGKYPNTKDERRLAWFAPKSDMQYHSIEAKIRVQKVVGGTGICLGMEWNAGQSWTGVCSQFWPDGNAVIAALEDPKWTEVPADFPAQVDQWYVMRFEYKNEQFYYYWNGQLIKSLTPTTPVGDSGNQPAVSFSLEETQAMTIEIDELILR